MSLLMVALNDKPDAVRRMRESYKIKSPIAMMPFTAQLPIDFGVATNRWTGQIPGYVLIRPDGEVSLIALGAVYANHIEKTIDCLISCPANEDVR